MLGRGFTPREWRVSEIEPLLFFPGAHHRDPVAAGMLGLVEAFVGQGDEVVLGKTGAGGAGAGHADADGDPVGFAAIVEDVFFGGLTNFFGDHQGLFDTGFRQDKDELLPPVAGDEVVFPDDGLGDATEFAQEKITGLVTVGVVEFFEMIDVRQQQGEGPFGADRPVDFRVEEVLKIAVIVNLGETVEVGQVFEQPVFLGQFLGEFSRAIFDLISSRFISS